MFGFVNSNQLDAVIDALCGKNDTRYEKKNIFKGTSDDWDDLSSEEKAKYDVRIFTDD